MSTEELRLLSDYIVSISPALWVDTLRYIYACAWQWASGAIVFTILGITLIVSEYKSEKGWEGGGYAFGTFILMVAFVCMITAVGRFVSPNMYAIKYLLDTYTLNVIQ